MDFRTAITPPQLNARIDHASRGLALGSCFAGNIASRLRAAKFPVVENPFGVLYNPASIARAVELLARGRRFTGTDLEYDGNVWYSFAHHGSFSSPDANEALAAMNAAAEEGAQALRRADYVILTLGTAWVWELGGCPVANCHKQPAARFTRRRMSVEEVTETLNTTIQKYFTGKNIILTVSPIRHLHDGLAENARSKAILLEAVHRVCEALPAAEYFPAFEILTDDLRDYRFYEADMLHPSATAVDYVWSLFQRSTMDAPARKLAAEAEKITAAANHRPLHAHTPARAAFRRTMAAKIETLRRDHPELDLSAEAAFFTAESPTK